MKCTAAADLTIKGYCELNKTFTGLYFVELKTLHNMEDKWRAKVFAFKMTQGNQFDCELCV